MLIYRTVLQTSQREILKILPAKEVGQCISMSHRQNAVQNHNTTTDSHSLENI
jgi:hypothetical protein